MCSKSWPKYGSVKKNCMSEEKPANGFDWNTEYHRVMRDEGRVVSKGQNVFPQVLLSKGMTWA